MTFFKINKEYIDRIKKEYGNREIILPPAEYREALKKVNKEFERHKNEVMQKEAEEWTK